MTVEIMGVDDTLGINVGSADHDLLAELLKSHITRNSVQICGEVQDELLTSLSRILGNGTDGEEHVLKMKRCLISIRMDHYPRFGHHESNNGTNMAAVLCWLSPMYILHPGLSEILTVSSRLRRVEFLSDRYSQGCGVNRSDKASCSVMGILVGQSKSPISVETEE